MISYPIIHSTYSRLSLLLYLNESDVVKFGYGIVALVRLEEEDRDEFFHWIGDDERIGAHSYSHVYGQQTEVREREDDMMKL